MKRLLLTTALFFFLSLYPAQSEPVIFFDQLKPVDTELQEKIKKIERLDSNLENIIKKLRLKVKNDNLNKNLKIDLASFLLKKVYLQRELPYEKNEELLLEAYDLLQDNFFLETIWGDIYFHIDEFERAIEHYETALICNPNGVNTAGLCGWAYFKNQNYEKALEKFDIYLNKNSDDYLILFYAGKCNFQLEDYEKTVDYCEKALEYCEDDDDKEDIEDLIRKAKEHLASTEGFTQDEDWHFVLSFAGSSKDDLGDLTSESLEDIYDEVTNFLNFDPDVKINVIFYLTDDYYKRAESWSAAQACGITIEVPLKYGYKDEVYVKGLLAHEFTHTIINLKTKGFNAPTWVHEGLAQYLEYSTRYGSPETIRSDYEEILQNDFIDGELFIPLNKVRSYMDSSERRDIRRAYIASYIAIRCMADNYGEQSFDKLLTSIGKGNDIERAVKDATGISYDKFQNEVKDWIKTQ